MSFAASGVSDKCPPRVRQIAQCNKGRDNALDPSQGFFGTGGLTTFDAEPQQFKIPHLNNAYQKVGMFGMPGIAFVDTPLADRQHQGEQIRGFGFLHDGSIATLFNFLHATVFSIDDNARHDIEQFILAYDTTFAPIVGQQVTLTSTNGAVAGPRISLLVARALTDFTLVDQPGAKECDVVAKAVVGGQARGYLLDPATGQFHSDRAAEPTVTDAQLRAVASTDGQQVTYTCAPPGEGVRLALDRDEDGRFDRDEIDAGSDPADPNDPPHATPTPSPSPTATPTVATCVGDCNADGRVTVDEILRGVNIALGNQSIDDCPSFARDNHGEVGVTQLIQAVNAVLRGCDAGGVVATLQ